MTNKHMKEEVVVCIMFIICRNNSEIRNEPTEPVFVAEWWIWNIKYIEMNMGLIDPAQVRCRDK